MVFIAGACLSAWLFYQIAIWSRDRLIAFVCKAFASALLLMLFVVIAR